MIINICTKVLLGATYSLKFKIIDFKLQSNILILLHKIYYIISQIIY